MTFPFGEPVTQLDGAATSRDGDGNDVASWPVKATYTGVAVAPSDGNGTSSNERVQGQDQVITGLTLYGIPDGADVAAVDRFVVRGDTYNVVGEPQAWRSPFTGWKPGYAVTLSKVTG